MTLGQRTLPPSLSDRHGIVRGAFRPLPRTRPQTLASHSTSTATTQIRSPSKLVTVVLRAIQRLTCPNRYQMERCLPPSSWFHLYLMPEEMFDLSTNHNLTNQVGNRMAEV